MTGTWHRRCEKCGTESVVPRSSTRCLGCGSIHTREVRG